MSQNNWHYKAEFWSDQHGKVYCIAPGYWIEDFELDPFQTLEHRGVYFQIGAKRPRKNSKSTRHGKILVVKMNPDGSVKKEAFLVRKSDLRRIP